MAPLDDERPSLLTLRTEFADAMFAFFQSQIDPMAAQIGALLSAHGLRKADRDDDIEFARIMADLNFDGWSAIVGDIDDVLARIVRNGSDAAFVQIGIDVEASSKVGQIVASAASDYAEQRAAEMVGMRVTATGAIIENPKAEWRITEGTRDFLRGVVRDAIAEGQSNDEIASAIRQSYGFSRERADVIARTETNLASNAGALQSYMASGVVSTKEWLTAQDDRVSEDCALNGDAGPIALDAAFPSGAFAPPDHPNCRCTLIPGVDWNKLGAIPSDLLATES